MFFTSCSTISDYRLIFKANNLYNKAAYSEALSYYLAVSPNFTDTSLRFNIANTYARLGQTNKARELYAQIEALKDKQLSSKAYYNEGVILYESQAYHDAYLAFQEALRLNPSDQDSRKNLELCLSDISYNAKLQAAPAPKQEHQDGSLSSIHKEVFQLFSTGTFQTGVNNKDSSDNNDDY